MDTPELELTAHDQLVQARQHRAWHEALLAEALGSQPEPIWCPVANIAREYAFGPGGTETRHGTRLFAPGAKVYVFPPLWDSYHEDGQLMVIGHHRASHRLQQVIVGVKLLTNWRVALVYRPAVIRMMMLEYFIRYGGQRATDPVVWMRERQPWKGTPESKAEAEQMAAAYRALFPQSVRDER